MKHRAPLVAAFLTVLGLVLSLAPSAAADTTHADAAPSAAADYYVNATHSVTSHAMTGARMWGKSSRQSQFTIAKGKSANIYDSDGSARVYMTYPAWRARANVSGSSYGPCHDGYSWSNPGLNTNGYIYKGYDNETCGDPGTKAASPTVRKFSTVPVAFAAPAATCTDDWVANAGEYWNSGHLNIVHVSHTNGNSSYLYKGDNSNGRCINVQGFHVPGGWDMIIWDGRTDTPVRRFNAQGWYNVPYNYDPSAHWFKGVDNGAPA